MKTKQGRGLGRGLSALMADVKDSAPTPDAERRAPDMMVPVEKVHPNPDQPRRHFDAGALEDLARSITEKGIIQPLIVRISPREAGCYEIVAGERRWRAAQMAQLHEVPVLVRDFTDTEVLEVAIIENIQRADLNPVEEAAGYSQLMTKFGHTQEKLAEVLGKSRSHIANAVRLLNLPDEVQGYLRDGRLSAGHARALITAPDAVAKAPSSKGKMEKDADTKALESDLSAALSMSVSIDHQPGNEHGALTIRYQSLDDLDRLMALLSA
jgi:ParB family chromosome partitioning protein